MKKGLLLVGVLSLGVIYIYNVRRKKNKSTSSEQRYNL